MTSVTVIIITLNRPECVRRCLTCLESQVPPPGQTIVVDASADNRTRAVVNEFPGTIYMHNPRGFGRMTASRNMALPACSGEIIAFVDDDAFAHEGWLAALLEVYAEHADAGAVGGRVLNGQPDESKLGVDRIGRLTRWGDIEGWFAADPGRVLEVNHVMGCNMSFRREVLAELGGFREDYRGISGVREDSDICLRVARLGKKIFFAPKAAVTHIGAPQATGRRFDARYAYYSARNHMVMLIRNFGPLAGITLRHPIWAEATAIRELARRIAGGLARLAAISAGMLVGIVCGLRLVFARGTEPRRLDPEADRIRRALSAHETIETADQPSASSGAAV